MMFMGTECKLFPFVIIFVLFHRFNSLNLHIFNLRCCDWGQGSYQLAFGDNVIATGGSFGESDTTTFTADNSSTPDDPPPNDPCPAPADCYPLYVNLSFDSYSQDESWEISQNGVIVKSSQPYDTGLTEDAQEVCLPAGDYVFTIYDVYQVSTIILYVVNYHCYFECKNNLPSLFQLALSTIYQDGMCCDWGEGSYSVTTNNEEVILAEGGEFGPSESTDFTFPTAC